MKFQASIAGQGHRGSLLQGSAKYVVLMLAICGVRPVPCLPRPPLPMKQPAVGNRPIFPARRHAYDRSHLRGLLSHQWLLFGRWQLLCQRGYQWPADGSIERGEWRQRLYAYGSSSVFPTSTFNATNYWVDVVFAASGSLGNQPPVANHDSGFMTSPNTSLAIPASALCWPTILIPIGLLCRSRASAPRSMERSTYNSSITDGNLRPDYQLHWAGRLHLFDHEWERRHCVSHCFIDRQRLNLEFVHSTSVAGYRDGQRHQFRGARS